MGCLCVKETSSVMLASVFILLLHVQLSTVSSQATNPGTCPAMPPFGPGFECPPSLLNTSSCTYDSDCGSEKCCVTKICDGRSCVASVEAPRPGNCPPLPPGNILIRCLNQTDACTYDSECPGTEKCCSRICNTMQCVNATDVPKPGTCPPQPPLIKGFKCPLPPADPVCTYDTDCCGARKCCAGMCDTMECV